MFFLKGLGFLADACLLVSDEEDDSQEEEDDENKQDKNGFLDLELSFS